MSLSKTYIGGSKKSRFEDYYARSLGTFAADASGKLYVFGHDGHSLGVNGTQVGVFEQPDQISFAGLLQSHDGTALKSQIGLEILSDFAHQTLKRQLANEQLSRLLVPSDFTKRYCTRSVTVGLLHASSSRRALSRSLGCQLLARSFSSSGFTSGLLRPCHFFHDVSRTKPCVRNKKSNPARAFKRAYIVDARICHWSNNRARIVQSRSCKLDDAEIFCQPFPVSKLTANNRFFTIPLVAALNGQSNMPSAFWYRWAFFSRYAV